MTYAIYCAGDTVPESYIESDDAQTAYRAAHARVRFLAREAVLAGGDRSSAVEVYSTARRSGTIEDSGNRAVPVYANRFSLSQVLR